MKRLVAALAFLFTSEAKAATLEPTACPFTGDTLTTHLAACSRFNREDDGVDISFDIAILTPRRNRSLGHVLYIPGGPGEAPVTQDGLFVEMLFSFEDHTVILFNPRGTTGTEPRLACDFGESIWDEDFGSADTQAILRGCIDRLAEDGPDPARFSSAEIADDVEALIATLGLSRVGTYGISYGTEASLHLLARSPAWLDFAILDSVSVPGLSGVEEEIEARERFLAALDRSCFAQDRCTSIARGGAASLSDWAAQFDDTPLTLYVQEDIAWTFDGTDMLDTLAQLGAYRDGLFVAQLMVELLGTNRLDALGWMKQDVESNTDFMRKNLPLMLQAYADTFDPADFETVKQPTRYPRDLGAAADMLAFYQLWRGAQPREVPLLDGEKQEAGVPVLVLSGGIDPFTPPEWATALHDRFAGLQHSIYPLLGHAVSVDTGLAPEESFIGTELHCAGRAIRVFLDPTEPRHERCSTYRVKGTP